MAPRNHYVVLGVAATESGEGIRAAFRERARRLHPDRVGPAGTRAFRELTEAYDVLRDPARRQAYDESLRSQPAGPRGPLRGGAEARRPPAEPLFDRFGRNVAPRGASKGEQSDELTVDVVLSEAEAGAGSTVRLEVPVFAPCPWCAARGCAQCAWQGGREVERPVTVRIPPMTGEGTTLVMPLPGPGSRDVYLRVRVRVERTAEPRG